MGEFTKGPWLYTWESDLFLYKYDDWGIVRSPDGHIITQLNCYSMNCDVDLAEHRNNGTDPTAANAHLISASPDMYEALKLLILQAENVLAPKLDDPSRIKEFTGIIKGREALAKAEGRS